MGNSAKFMLVGILVVVLLIAMIWDRSNEQGIEPAKSYPIANITTDETVGEVRTAVEVVDDVIARGTVGQNGTGGDTTGPSYVTSTPATVDDLTSGTAGAGTTTDGLTGNGARESENGDNEETTVTVPYREAEMNLTPPEPKIYVTKQGDSYWSIAEKQMGSGAKWKKLHEANKHVCPDVLLVRPGMKFVIPEEEPAPARVEDTAPEGGDMEEGFYVVKSGDSLWKIAEALYNKPMRYKEIYKLNRDKLDSEEVMLKVGMKLRLP